MITKSQTNVRKCVIGVVSLSILVACSSANDIPVQGKNKAIGNSDIPSELVQCSGIIHPEQWPYVSASLIRDAKDEQEIEGLLSKMTLEEKVGQIIQADISAITPEEVKSYHIGSVLNGGDSAPDGNVRSKPEAWLQLADDYWLASTDKTGNRVGIPILWGTDAVHGHNNIVGATIFPHNIGLGAARNPGLIKAIAQATAKEVLTTGMDWTFAPTVAVARDDRWGRTYESYSELPEIVTQYAGEIVDGLQGAKDSDSFLDSNSVLATVKHFIGDGGTYLGQDQGNNVASEKELVEMLRPPYQESINRGAMVVMASFSSWCGQKMHGIKPLLQDVLFDRMGFDGFVISDWDAHSQLPGCTTESCPAAINAGIDMYMAPINWKPLYRNLIKEVKSNQISTERLDQAVARILRVKLRMGLFAEGKPSERKWAGEFEWLGHPDHRAIARKAVRESLVLLKNNNDTLPLSGQEKVLVIGKSAKDIGIQSGGWTLSWQGNGNENHHFPNGDTIFQGILSAMKSKGGEIRYSEYGAVDWVPDVVIAVYGEEPYAEMKGDKSDLEFNSGSVYHILKDFKSKGVKTISVFLSGRPMWVNKELNVSDAFVAAWLPGSEGAGVADLIIQDKKSLRFDFTGKLPFSWPNHADQTPLNMGAENYSPLFPYGYGLSYSKSHDQLGKLSEVRLLRVANE